MNAIPLPAAGLGAILSLSVQLSVGATRMEGRVVDDATGQPLAARVALTDTDGKPVELAGEHAHVQYLDKRWCYVDGGFSLTLPNRGVLVEIRRGLETRPLTFTIAPDPGGAEIRRTFRLRRWINLRQQGYVCGDFHAHLPVPREARPQMKAEALDALTLLHVTDSQSPCPINDCFIGRMDPIRARVAKSGSARRSETGRWDTSP